MGYAELIETLRALPPDKQTEVFDFVAFLAAQSRIRVGGVGAQAASDDWNDAEFARLALAQAMRGLEEEAVTYSPTDMKERWQ